MPNLIRLPLVCLALLAAVCLSPSLAQTTMAPLHFHPLQQSVAPAALKGLKVFHFGTAQMRLIPQAIHLAPQSGSGGMFMTLSGTPPKTVLTPGAPIVPGVANLIFSSATGQLVVFTAGSSSYATLSSTGATGNSPFVLLELYGVANQSYLIDANLYASGASGVPCQIIVQGPDNSQQTSNCESSPTYQAQDIYFVYKAEQSGLVGFTITIPANVIMTFNSISLAPMP